MAARVVARAARVVVPLEFEQLGPRRRGRIGALPDNVSAFAAIDESGQMANLIPLEYTPRARLARLEEDVPHLGEKATGRLSLSIK
jgi:hypothetical protein